MDSDQIDLIDIEVEDDLSMMQDLCDDLNKVSRITNLEIQNIARLNFEFKDNISDDDIGDTSELLLTNN